MSNPHQAALSSTLARFLAHVEHDQVALTGSAAIRVHLRDEHEPIGDLDFVMASLGALRPSVTRDFLVSHYHVPQNGSPKFMVQLVDPVARMRVDVFPDSLGAIPRAASHHVGGRRVLVLAAADVLRHKREILDKSSSQHPVDPKHLRHARVLAHFLGEALAPIPDTCLREDVHRRDFAAYLCDRCERSVNVEFPLADKAKIFAILGYV